MRDVGTQFEDLALAHAQKNGLRLIERNFTCRHGELDLIMRDREVVVFVEVRYRRSGAFGGAIDSVGPSKQRRLIKAASLFLQQHPDLSRQPCRFDVIALEGTAEAARIEWLRNAFETT